jgi:hypothetical protein
MNTDLTAISHHLPSDRLSLDLSGPVVNRAAVKRALALTTEIEAKFFMPHAVADRVTADLPFVQIEQRYFPPEKVMPLLERFVINQPLTVNNQELYLPVEVVRRELADISIARIRSISEPGGETAYFIEFKGPKVGAEGSRISRPELSKPITAKHYKSLAERATAGIVCKRRYELHGSITVEKGSVPRKAQIDYLEAAGKRVQTVDRDLYTVDIELLDPAHLSVLRTGEHTFDFLSECIELDSHNDEIAKILTTRRLAKNGLSSEAMHAIKVLEKRARALAVTVQG